MKYPNTGKCTTKTQAVDTRAGLSEVSRRNNERLARIREAVCFV